MAAIQRRKQADNCSTGGIRLRWLALLVLLCYLLGLWVVNSGVKKMQQTSPTFPTNNSGSGGSGTALSQQAAATTTTRVIQSTNPDFPREPKPRPLLDNILQGWNITGDPSWLLNLAIIGFPKTGTSTLMKYLHMSPQIHVFDEERCEMGYNQHVRLMESLYKDMPPGDMIRGIKCPRDLEVPLALQNYQTHFPKTDFMVGFRHPVEWFESFYNFRVNNFFTMPPAETLVGRCSRRHQGLCTSRGNFHLFLANLGKTNILTDPNEQILIPKEYRKMIKPVPLKGRIFLWDISQLKQDKVEETLSTQSHTQRHSNAKFREDLQQFLRLEEPLPEMIWVKPGFAHSNTTIKEQVASQKIDICDDQYRALRAVLLQQGALAAHWIKIYFLEAEGVFVSQKEYFSSVVLASWGRDPCPDRRAAVQT